jgi:hypothetical protein
VDAARVSAAICDQVIEPVTSTCPSNATCSGVPAIVRCHTSNPGITDDGTLTVSCGYRQEVRNASGQLISASMNRFTTAHFRIEAP